MAHVKLTEQQRIAACVFFGLACLVWPGRTDDLWWYRWCTERSFAARDRMESACWWAIRFADEEGREVAPESAAKWLAYVEYVMSYRRGRR